MRLALARPSMVQNCRLACPPAPQTLAKVVKRLKASPQLMCSLVVGGQGDPISGLAILAPVILK